MTLKSALLLGVFVVALRDVLVLLRSPYGSIDYIVGSLVGIPEAALYFVLPILLLNIKSAVIRYLGMVLLIILLILYQVFIHYELVFGYLPGISILYYLNEIEHLVPSLQTNVPVWLFLGEVMVLLLLWRVVERRVRIGEKLSIAIILIAIGVGVFASRFSGYLPEGGYWASKNPFSWIIGSAGLGDVGEAGAVLDKKIVWRFQSAIGQHFPKGGYSADYPLCGPPLSKYRINGRSVIILFLEGVGHKELSMMPNLRRFAEDNIYFRNVYSSGTKSSQAMVSAFTGLPAQPVQNILWHIPLPETQSFVSSIRSMGYESGYFHGGDLSFEQQRSFLRRIGFDYIFELDHDLEIPIYGWGYDDGVVFREMESWIESLAGAPYVAALFSLSTHDPYRIPDEWRKKRSGSGAKQQSPMFESYMFLDDQFRRFVEWFKQSERDKDSIIIAFGDHTPHYWNEAHDGKNREMTFNVPLIIAGHDLPIKSEVVEQRRASLIDIPATIAGLLGTESLPCDQGLDLLGSDWPEDRWVYAVGGDSQERVYMWNSDGQVLLDRLAGNLRVLDYETPVESARKDLRLRLLEAKNFLDLVFPINEYLIKNDAYAPAPMRPQERRSIDDVVMPIFVAHRANVNGPNSGVVENSQEALESVVESNFDWAEIDFQLTSDDRVVAVHDGYVGGGETKVSVLNLSLAQIKSLPGYENTLTLEEVIEVYSDRLNLLIELKPPVGGMVQDQFRLVKATLEALKNHSGVKRYIVDSFSSIMADSMSRYCDCEVAQDAPYKERPSGKYLSSLAEKDVEWVYLHYSVVDEKIINMAHSLGLRVMAYTVNDMGIIRQWQKTALPDGIITDSQQLLNSFHRLSIQ